MYNESYPFLLPKTYDDHDDLRVKDWKYFLDSQPYKVDAQVRCEDDENIDGDFEIFSVFVRWDLGQLERKQLNHLFKMHIFK